jgi:hypothetical protein
MLREKQRCRLVLVGLFSASSCEQHRTSHAYNYTLNTQHGTFHLTQQDIYPHMDAEPT